MNPLGDQELEVLRYVSDHGPVTVRVVVERFGEPQSLARTTILTVMERLRKKGYLTRQKSNGVFEYAPATPKGEVLQEIVKEFVEKTLAGSLSPFVAYLAAAKGLTTSEVQQLRSLVDDMEGEDVR